MALRLYELRILKERSLSPYVWRARLALAHKGLEADLVPIGYGEKHRLAFSGQDRVPVLVDGERAVSDSWNIASYLEEAYPDRPSLFGGPQGRALSLFVNRWADTVQNATLAPLLAPDSYDHVPPADRPYFAESRHARYGRSIDELRADPAGKIARIREMLEPVRQTLARQPFLTGERPGYADYIVFGGFQWARTISRHVLLAPDDPVHAWRGRILGLFDGLAGRAAGYDVDGGAA